MSERRFTNSIDYWRRRRGYTWQALATAIGLKSYPPLMRAACLDGSSQIYSGGGIGRAKMLQLARVLEVDLWQLYVPAEEAEKKFA